jgi:ribosomal protein L5
MFKRLFSSTVQRQPLLTNEPFLPRLEYFYYNQLYKDLLLLNYDHSGLDFDKLEDAETEINEIYKLQVHKLPSYDQHITGILSPPEPLPQRKIRKKLKNPIDYTAIPKEIFNAPDFVPVDLRFSPKLDRVPKLKSIVLDIYTEEAIANKSVLLAALMALQAICGVRPDPVLAKKGILKLVYLGDASRKIRQGMPIGAKVKLEGPDMYHFLDKLVQTVMPRIREFEGIYPGDGVVEFKLDASTVGTFPDIEPHFDSFPRLFDTTVTINTSARSEYETVGLLSGIDYSDLYRISNSIHEKKRCSNQQGC